MGILVMDTGLEEELLRRCEAVLDWKPSTPGQVAQVLGIQVDAARALCRELAARGRVRYVDRRRLASLAHQRRNP